MVKQTYGSLKDISQNNIPDKPETNQPSKNYTIAHLDKVLAPDSFQTFN